MRHVHVIIGEEGVWVFGWDPPLMSYFLQLHNLDIPEDDNPVIWVGAQSEDQIREVEDLINVARQHGLYIDHTTRVILHGERLDGD